MILQVLNSPRFKKAVHRAVTLVLTFALLIAMAPVFSFDALAVTTKYGKVTVSEGSLNVRSGPGTGNSAIGSVFKGEKVVIVEEANDTDGALWYKIEYKTAQDDYGYVSAAYITLYDPDENTGTEGGGETDTEGDDEDITVPDMTDFEGWLTSQGFPESYKPELRALHEKYPNWIFKADHIKYDWETILQAQMKLGVSLVENSFPSSWKSTQPGAYNWETSKWIPLDGTRWVQASRDIIEYYLDPRNFLDSTTVFQFLEQGFDETTQTLKGVQSMLNGTFMAGELPDEEGVTYAELIYSVSKANNVNPYVIASMIITEQGLTGSALSSGKHPGFEGYYNFFNYNAYGSNPVTSGLTYAKTKGWNTVRKSITAGTESFAGGYVSIGQSTLYYKRFDYVGTPFTHQYSTSVYSPKIEGERAARSYTEEMRQTALSFTIPVYTGMPETACIKPTGDGSPNVKLGSLSVEGFSLTPDFQPDILEYILVVPESTGSVNVKATTLDSVAKVAGTGTVQLPDLENTITVTVTAGNGDTRDYTLIIAKEVPEEDGSAQFSDNYVLNGTYIMTAPGTIAETMAGNLLNTGKCIITHSDETEKDNAEVLKTGDRVIVYDEEDELLGVYVVCIKGDINGDGIISSADCIKTRNHMLNKGTLEGVSFAAADVTGDGTITSSDVIKIRNHMLGKSQLS